tara:strand:+ start:23253 stop:26048 length:2796 start_codon:yes stop_codon:yes gene_type:complete
MKKSFLLSLLSILFISLSATTHSHHDDNEIRFVKNKQPLDNQYQEYLRKNTVWSQFQSANSNWYVIFNEQNRLPHRAFGSPIQINNINDFLIDNNFNLPSDLRELYSNKNDNYTTKKFIQYHNNLEVIGSSLYAKLTNDNKIVAFGMDLFNNINVAVNPTIDINEAINSATSNISNLVTNISVEDDLKILAVPVYRDYEYHLIYQLSFSTTIEHGPAKYLCYVDANTGQLLMRKNMVMYEAPPSGTSTVSGEIYTSNPYNGSSIEKFKYLKAIDQNTNINYFTDNNGEVFLPSNIGTVIRYKLEGEYANVETNGTTPDIFDNLSSTNLINFDNSNSTIQERTAYWAVNEIHDHMKFYFPTYTGLDNPMQTNIDVSGSCNAYFDGSSINFYAQGGGCHATANLPDVVYHEYGHAINSGRYNGSGWNGGMSNGGLNEGFADVWAISLTENPVLGYGWDLLDPTIFVRRYDQDRKVYPQDLVGEVHADGEIIAGAFWDLYLNLGDMNQMLNLFKYTYDSGVDGPDGDEGVIYTDILLEVLFADDNDADLSNGTPNDLAIISAFDLHGITLLSNAVISHNPVQVANANMPININANVGLTYPWALGSTNCYYKINDANTWTNLPMNGVTSFTTSIPSQPNGTVIAYYLSLTDNFGNESAVTPIASNIIPIKDANLPNFILVGFDIMQEEDFDGNFGFWQTGGFDDNATTGIWEIGVPIPSYGVYGDASTICQTDAQNTPGGSQCAFTGNATSSQSGLGENDVDGGHTTLYSPSYDLSSFLNPAFSYYRWYTNSPYSGANPGADWWQVMISDDGVNWVYVEDNISSDLSWRKFAFRVNDYVSLTNNVQLKFIASDSIRLGQNLDGGSLIEAAVDDLILYEARESSTNLNNITGIENKLIKITDLLGREVSNNNLLEHKVLIYIYDNGTVKRKLNNF